MKQNSRKYCEKMQSSISLRVKVAQSCPTLCDPMDCQWNFPGQNTGEDSRSLLQGIFPTQGLNSGLLHCRQIKMVARFLVWMVDPSKQMLKQ